MQIGEKMDNIIKREDWKEDEWTKMLSVWLKFCRFSKPRKKVTGIIMLNNKQRKRKLKGWNIDKEYVKILESSAKDQDRKIDIPFINIVSCEYK